MSESLVRGWSWHRLRRITGQLVFYYGQITASLIHPPATGHCQLRGWLFGIHKTTQLLFVYQHQKSEITTTDKSLYYIYFWTLHVKMLCNLSHLYCWTACWDGLLKVPLSTILHVEAASWSWAHRQSWGKLSVSRHVTRARDDGLDYRLHCPLMLNITIMKTLKPQ